MIDTCVFLMYKNVYVSGNAVNKKSEISLLFSAYSVS